MQCDADELDHVVYATEFSRCGHTFQPKNALSLDLHLHLEGRADASLQRMLYEKFV
jgi:hypothetical protein